MTKQVEVSSAKEIGQPSQPVWMQWAYQNIAHELRTPLTVVLGYLEMLMADPEAIGDVEQRRIIHTMLRNAKQLHTAIERLLTLQAFTMMGAHIERVPLCLHSLILQELHHWQEDAQQRGVRIEYYSYASTAWVLGEPNLLRQLLTLLVENGIKFSQPSSLARHTRPPAPQKVQIILWQSANTLHMAVTDYGIGLPRQALKHVFDPFFQVQGGPNRPYEGLGIGLSLARSIVEAHKGRIWAESEGEGKGSTFHIELPREYILPNYAHAAALVPARRIPSYR